jgi:hypothetical protein
MKFWLCIGTLIVPASVNTNMHAHSTFCLMSTQQLLKVLLHNCVKSNTTQHRPVIIGPLITIL